MKTLYILLIVANAVLAQSDCNKVGYIPGDDGYCYKVVETKSKFEDAAIDCAKAGARLASITDAKQSQVIVSLAQPIISKSEVFIGYTQLGPLRFIGAIHPWYWDNPTPTNDKKPTYVPWLHAEQKGDVALLTKTGQWDTHLWKTTNKYPYVCQYMNNNVGACASKSIATFPFQPLQSTSKCYSIIDNVKQNQAYSENQCRTFGGHLAKIQSQDENDFLLQKFCWECIGNGTAQAFIGLYVAQDGSYMWTDGTKLQKGSYTNFNYQPGYGKCVVMNSSDGTWSYADCNSLNAYAFCNRAMTTTK